MRSKPSICAALILAGTPVFAHRLDEYLQATLISVEKDRIEAEIRLAPGVAVLPVVLAAIDTNADGVISKAEQHAYAQRVLDDLSISLDGDRVKLQLVSMQFPAMQDLREGLGEIHLKVSARVPRTGANRRLIFENRHQSAIGVYLVNCLVPSDPDIRIAAQNRNYTQSVYQLDYVQSRDRADALSLAGWRAGSGLLIVLALLLVSRFALVWRHQRARCHST